MDIESVRTYCLSFPHATEDIQWINDLLFRVGKKIFASVDLEGPSLGLSFKCTPEKFAELVEMQGIRPAPYAARYHWVRIDDPEALPRQQIEELIGGSYRMVFEKLPKKLKAELGG